MILGQDGPVVIVDGRSALILRDALRRWRAEHQRHGTRQKLTAVLPLLEEWEQVAATYAATLMSDEGRDASTVAARQETIGTVGTAEASQRLGISARQVRRLITSGDLPARTVGRTVVLDPVDVENLRQLRRSA